MSRPSSIFNRYLIAAVALIAGLHSQSAFAQTTWYWDGSTSILNDQSDNTTTAALNWLSGGDWDNGTASAPLASWTSGDSAIFGGTAATETITAGTFTVGNMTFGGATGIGTSGTSYTLTGGTLTIASGSTITANTNTTIASIISGTSGFTETGVGLLTLSSTSNSFSGGLSINAGAVAISAATNLPSGNALTLSNGGSLRMTASITLANNVSIAGGQTGTLKMVGAATAALSGNYSGVAGTLTLDEASETANFGGFNLTSSSGPALGSVVDILATTSAQNVQIQNNTSLATQAFFANAKVSITASGSGLTYFQFGNNSAIATPNAQFGALDGGNATTTIGFDNRTGITTINGTANGNFAGVLANGGAAGPAMFVKNGASTQILTGANTYTGTTTINGGILQIGAGGTVGSLSPNSAITNNATLVFDRSDAISQGTQFSSSAISGTGGLTQLGSGTLTLTAANTYTGPTTVSAGKLVINGSSTTASISVAGGATLAGAGTVTGAATVVDTGIIEAGNGGIGSLRLGGLTFSGSATINIPGALSQYTGTAALIDMGALTTNGTGPIMINLPTTTLSAGTYRLLSYSTLNPSGFTFTPGTVPTVGGGLVAQFVNSPQELDYVVSSGNVTTWTGALSSEWSTNTLPSPKNWASGIPSAPSDFVNGTDVHFTAAAANQVVDISQANVMPTSATFDSGAYTLKSTPGTFGIAGSGILAVNGGSLRVTNTNTYTGGTNLAGGLLSFVSGGLGSSGTVTFSGSSTLQWAAGNTDDLSSRIAINTGISATIDVQTNNVTFGSPLSSSAGALVKVGSGTLTLLAPNTFGGGTTLQAGTIAFASGAFGASGNITFAANSTLQWISGNTDDLSARLVMTNGIAATIDTQGNNVTLATAFGNSSSGNLVKIGSGTLTLSGTNTFTGGLAINGGSVALPATTNIPAANTISLTNGSSLLLSATANLANNVVVASGQTGTIRVTGSFLPTLSGDYSGVTGTLILDESAAAGYNGFNIGTASGPAVGSVVKVLGTTGAGNVQIGINTSVSQSFFANAKVSITATGAGNTYFAAGNSSATNAQFGALDGGNATTIIGFDNSGSGHTVTIDGLADGDFAGAIFNGLGGSNGINLVKLGAAMQTLSGSNTYNGSTTISGGTLRIGDGGTSGSLAAGSAIIDNATLAFNRSDAIVQGTQFGSAPITGSGGVIQMGAGTVTFNAANTYSGPTSIQNGVVSVTSLNSVVGGSPGASLGHPTTAAAGTISLGSGSQTGELSYTGSGQATDRIIDLAGTTGGGVLDSSGSGGLTFTSGFTASGAGAKTLTLQGSFNGVNTIQGTIVDHDGGNPTSLVKAGGGAWALAGNNTFTGPTTVSSGKLYLNGSNATSAITVDSGATLGGTGSSGGAVTVTDSGTIEAGFSGTGTLTLNGLTFSNTATVNITGSLSQYTSSPAIDDTGALTAGADGSVVINLPTGGLASGTYRLLSYSGGLNNFNAFTLGTQPAIGARQSKQFIDNANEIDLVITGLSAVWTGAFSSEWSTNTIPSPQNWKLSGSGTSTDFLTGDTVEFDNTAANQVVDISQADVSPASVNVNSGNYTLQSTPGTFGIAGAGSLSVNGGSLRITNVNSYTGGTTLSGGLLSFVSGGLSVSGTISFTGNATLQWAAGNTQDLSGRLTIHDGAVATLDVQGNNVTFASSFGGGGALAKSGSGTLTLAAVNNYAGGTTINNGMIAFVNGGLGNSGPVRFAGNSTLQWTSGNTQDLSGRLSVADGVAATLDTQDNNITFAGAIGGNTGSVIKIGTGTLTLSGNSTFTGGLTINGGGVAIGSALNLDPANTIALANGGSLQLTASLSLANSVVVASGQTGTLRLSGAVTGTLSGDYSGVAGTLTWDESGVTSNFGGANITSSNGPALGSVVKLIGSTSAQNVQVGNNISLANQAFFANSKLSITATGTGLTYLQYGNNVQSPNAQFGALDGGNATTMIAFDNRTGTFTIAGTADGDFAGVLANGGGGSGPANFIKNGSSTQTLSGANTYSGTTTISGGTLRIGDGGSSGSLAPGGTIIDNATLAFDLSGFATQGTQFSSSPITGSGGLAQNGTGNLTLNVDNSYTGPTVVNAGTLTLNGNLTATSSLAVNDGATLTGSGSLSAPVTLTGVATGATIGGSDTLTLGAGLIVNGPFNTLGTGTVSVAGTTTINSGGSLAVNGTLGGSGGTTVAGSLTGSGTINQPVTLAAGGSISSSTPGLLTLNNTLTASGSNTSLPSGTVFVAGATTVNSGASLAVNGALTGTGATSVSGTLRGTGTISQAVTIASGGTLAAASGASLTLSGGLTLSDGSFSSFALTPDAVGNSTALAAVTQGLTVPSLATNTVNFSGTAAIGTYDLISFDSGSPTLSQFVPGTYPSGNFTYHLSIANNQLDLVVSPANASASWNTNGDGNFSEDAKWTPTLHPSGPGQSATFGNGGGTTINASTVAVTIDAAYTLGSVAFNNTNGTSYTLASGGAGTGLTLDSGAGSGTSITVTAGSQTIAANLTLADAGGQSFTVSPSASLLVSGAIGETGGARSIVLNGGGTLTMGNFNTYTGGNTVNAGTLRTTAFGSLGTGPLTVNSAGTATPNVDVMSVESVGALTGGVSGTGSATVTVEPAKSLTVAPASGTAMFAGTVNLVAGNMMNPGSGGTLGKAGAGTEVLSGAVQLNDGSELKVSSGTLRINATGGTLGQGVTANVTGTGTLELAGAYSALGTTTAATRVPISNMSTATVGVLISSGDQQVGGIDGPGNVQIAPPENDTVSLTADHITAGALVIGGDATSSALVTIAASNPDGSPLASSGFALAGSLANTAPLASGALSAPSLLTAGDSSGGGSNLGGSTLSGLNLGGGVAAVPEPSTLLLLIFGGVACLLPAVRRRIRK